MAIRRIGVAAGDQALDDRDHFGDMFGRPRLDIGGQAAQRRHILLEDSVGLFGEFADGNPALGGAGVDLVVDVGDVADIGDMTRAIFFAQQAIKHVEDDQRTGVADMGEIIDRRPADIEPHIARVERRKDFPIASQGIVKFQGRRDGHDSPWLWPGRRSRGDSGET
jgi:hypothetical protein